MPNKLQAALCKGARHCFDIKAIMFLQRHSIDQSDPFENIQDFINDRRRNSDDQFSILFEMISDIFGQFGLVIQRNMLQNRKHCDYIISGDIERNVFWKPSPN